MADTGLKKSLRAPSETPLHRSRKKAVISDQWFMIMEGSAMNITIGARIALMIVPTAPRLSSQSHARLIAAPTASTA